MTTANQVKKWLDFALQQLAAESYLQDLDDLSDRQAVIDRLKYGFNNPAHDYIKRLVLEQGDQGADTPLLPGANRMPALLSERFFDEYEIVEQFQNNQVGFSATLTRRRGTEEYTLSFKSLEYPNWDEGGDWERDGLPGAAGEIGGLGFAVGQLASMEEYYRSLRAEGGRLAGVGQINVSGYSLGGHLATVFTLMHASDVKDGGVVTFNGAGHGNIRGAAPTGVLVAQMLAEFNRILRDPGSVEIDGLEGARDAAISRWSADRAWEPFASENGDLTNRRSAYNDPRYTFARDAVARLFELGSLAPGSGYLNGATPMDVEPYDSKITQLFGLATHDDSTIVANSQRHSANRVRIFIEDQPEVSGVPVFFGQGTFGGTHNMAHILDTLSLVQLFQTVTPSLSLEAVQGILAATSNLRGQGLPVVGKGRAEADALENALDALRKLLADSRGEAVTGTKFDDDARAFGNFANRSKFHENLQQAKDWLTASAGTLTLESLVQPLGNDPTTGAVPSPTKTADELFALARDGDIAYRYALKALNPFVVKGDALYQPFLQGRAREEELAVFNPANGKGELTERYLKDRAAFLHAKLVVNLNNLNNDLTRPVNSAADPAVYPSELLVTLRDTIFEDRTFDYRIDRRDASEAQNLLFTKHVIFGSDASETLEGKREADSLYGGAGDDQLIGQDEADYLEGGPGVDTYVINSGEGADTVHDTGRNFIRWNGQLIGGAFEKEADGVYRFLSSDPALGNLTLTFNSPATLSDGSGGSLTLLDYDSPEDFADEDFGFSLLAARTDPVAVRVLTGDASPEDPADFITGTASNERIVGGSGDDFLVGGGGDDYVDGGSGADYVYGDDRFSAGDDVLLGGAGGDVLIGGRSADRLYADVAVSTAEAIAAGVVAGTAAKGDWLAGGEGDDVLVGGEAGDVLSGGGGRDVLVGGGGADFLMGDADYLPGGADWAFGLQPDGRPNYYAGEPALDDPATSASDVLYGGGGDDWASGGRGDDVIYGEGGDDVILGTLGSDILIGGAGADVLGAGSRTQVDLADAGDDYLDGGDGDDRLYGNRGNSYFDGGDGNDRIETGPEADLVFGGEGDDTILANGGDVVDAGDGDDTVRGYGADAVRFSGGAGADFLSGSFGDDELRGEEGEDRLYGAEGADYMDGGLGNDRYVFGIGNGVDRIEDAGGNDVVVLYTDDSAPTEGQIARDSIRLVADNSEIYLTYGTQGDRIRLGADPYRLIEAIELRCFVGGVETIETIDFADLWADYLGESEPENSAPTLSGVLANVAAVEDDELTAVVPADAFADPDGDALAVVASLSDESPLPAWLSFDPVTRTFAGTPENRDVG